MVKTDEEEPESCGSTSVRGVLINGQVRTRKETERPRDTDWRLRKGDANRISRPTSINPTVRDPNPLAILPVPVYTPLAISLTNILSLSHL